MKRVILVASLLCVTAGCAIPSSLLIPFFNFNFGDQTFGKKSETVKPSPVIDKDGTVVWMPEEDRPVIDTKAWYIRYAPYIGLGIFGVWLLGISGLTWLWRRARMAFAEVVRGAQALKERVQEHIAPDEANAILEAHQSEATKKQVQKVKGKVAA